MKYLKTFEIKFPSSLATNYNVYWRIECKSLPYIIVSLKKIGLPPDEQCYNDIIRDFKNDRLLDHIYIGKGINDNGEFWWFYTVNISEFKGEFRFLGKVKVSKVEISADKFNI